MNKSKQRINFFTLDLTKYTEVNQLNIQKVSDIINKDRLVIISWLRNIWKLNFIKNLLNKARINNNYFYLNKLTDTENYISNWNDLESLLNEYIQLYKKPNIIILQNIEKLDWIKDFITKIYNQDYKIILIWNNIKIWGIKEIEILNCFDLNDDNLMNTLIFWSFNELKQLNKLEQTESNELKEKFLKFITSDILLNDIFSNFWVKSIELYNFTISYLAENNIFISLRDLQKNLDSINKISLKTTIDYIDFSIQTKIIKRVYKFDIKTNKPITSKAKYYFTDNWIRNSLTNFDLSRETLLENLIFNILECNNYIIYTWLNWKFDFSFYWEKEDSSRKIYIHISKQTQKEELKKEVNKLLKIWNEWVKYLLVDNIEKLWIKKFKYDSVIIMNIEDFLKNFGK